MDYALVISGIVLGLSLLASLAKLLDWFLHGDPQTMVRTTRWMLLLLMLASLPLLVLGIALIAVGVLWTLANLGHLDLLDTLHRWWPSILVLWGALSLARSLARHDAAGHGR